MEDMQDQTTTLESRARAETSQIAAKKVKPVLKHETAKFSAGSNPSEPRSSASRHLQWDEHAIAEHDTLRGTRQKIDEPKTPFASFNEAGCEDGSCQPRSPCEESSKHVALADQWGALEHKLTHVAEKQERRERSGSVSSVEKKAENIESHEEFERDRKMHYNEFEAMKRFRAEHLDDEDEDET